MVMLFKFIGYAVPQTKRTHVITKLKTKSIIVFGGKEFLAYLNKTSLFFVDIDFFHLHHPEKNIQGFGYEVETVYKLMINPLKKELVSD